MSNTSRHGWALAATALVAAQPLAAAPQGEQIYALPPALQAKIAAQPHTRRLTDWGSRPDWSADGSKLLFVSKEYGDLFEIDIAKDKTRPLSFHFSHEGIFRAYYLANGDVLLTAAADHVTGLDRYSRFHESELWLLKANSAAAPVRLGEPNFEGVAVSRAGMRIVWARDTVKPPEKRPEAEARVKISGSNQLWTGTVPTDGASGIADRRMVLDCGAPTGAFARLLAQAGDRCFGVEPQNFIPGKPDRVTFTMVSLSAKGEVRMGAYALDLASGDVSTLRAGREYLEAEGVFSDGQSTLIEHRPGIATNLTKAAETVELWQLALDGSGTVKRVTDYQALDPELKSNQGVVSPDGRWLAYTVSTATIERQVQGQGIGLFLMDLKAAGF
jgi:hypothetical protein